MWGTREPLQCLDFTELTRGFWAVFYSFSPCEFAGCCWSRFGIAKLSNWLPAFANAVWFACCVFFRMFNTVLCGIYMGMCEIGCVFQDDPKRLIFLAKNKVTPCYAKKKQTMFGFILRNSTGTQWSLLMVNNQLMAEQPQPPTTLLLEIRSHLF